MMVAKTLRRLVALSFGIAVLLPAAPVLAQSAPANDDFGSATVISTLPFSDNIDTTGATSAADDPTACGDNGSVWYSFTASQNQGITANTFGSNYDTVLSVYTQAAFGLVLLSCNDDASGTLQSHLAFNATAGTTYFFMVSRCCGTGGSGGGQLVFNVSAPQPPSNDNFSNATRITGLPFSDAVDTTGATLEPGEPTPSCIASGGQLDGSVWYAFTPATSESVSASTEPTFVNEVAAYTGTALGNLAQAGCNPGQSAMTIHVNAGTTYYFQVGGVSGQRGPLTLHLDVAQPPAASFTLFPSDPSIFDTIQFIDESFDPGDAGIQSEAWDFGDGTTGTGSFPTHRYAADGDYATRLTVTTVDGRTATATQVIHVSTHDVAITKFTVPTSASAGQTRSITVGVSDKRYPETVQVDLLKGNPQGGFDPVGTVTQSVPVQTGKATTSFAFSYTFTPGDASVGKVTLEAIATIVGSRDALPTDNTAIASTSIH